MAEVVRYECDSCGSTKPAKLTFVVGLVLGGPRKHLCWECAVGLDTYAELLGIPTRFLEPSLGRLGCLALWVEPLKQTALPIGWPETEKEV